MWIRCSASGQSSAFALQPERDRIAESVARDVSGGGVAARGAERDDGGRLQASRPRHAASVSLRDLRVAGDGITRIAQRVDDLFEGQFVFVELDGDGVCVHVGRD